MSQVQKSAALGPRERRMRGIPHVPPIQYSVVVPIWLIILDPDLIAKRVASMTGLVRGAAVTPPIDAELTI